MAILVLGVSHRRAPVELLERLAFGDDDYVKAFRLAVDQDALDEAVILSTCNRVEVYGAVQSYHAGFQALKRVLCDSRTVVPEELAKPLYSHYEDDAAHHLFSVAGGLDSMVLGEPQILAQVRDAHRRARAEHAAGPVLTGLFHAAARAGRLVRTQTAIGVSPATFVEAGARLAEQALGGGLAGRPTVVVGAGQMAALAVKHLRRRGVGPVRVLSRSEARARALAERTRAEAGDLAALPRALSRADLVISATGAAGAVITQEAVRAALRDREPGRPLFILDLAVPRDVEPSVADLPGVRLVDIDGIGATLEGQRAGTADEIARARDIVAEEVRRFALRRRADRLAPLITALRERAGAVQAAELARYRSSLSSLTDDERAAVEAIARGIVAKLLHDPIVRLKELSGPGADDAYAKALAELFGIEYRPEYRPG